MTDGRMAEQVPDEYLDIVVTCPVPQGEAQGAQPLREVLASDIGPKILPRVVENIRNAQELAESGIEADRATIIAFGGAVVEDEHGGILREPDHEPDDMPEPAYADADLEPQLEAAEKK